MSELILNRIEVKPGVVCPKCSAPLTSNDALVSGEAVSRLELICSRCHSTAVCAEFESSSDKGDDPWE
jgi:DNA-directed RNA polymerase subunit RPC12/RpoP